MKTLFYLVITKNTRNLNKEILNLINNKSNTYFSIDYTKSKFVDQSEEDTNLNYPIEF